MVAKTQNKELDCLTGIVELLYQACFDVFSQTWKLIFTNTAPAKSIKLKRGDLKESFTKFVIWHEGIDAGKWDKVLQYSKHLRDNILDNLYGIGIVLLKAISQSIHAEYNTYLSELDSLIEKGRSVISGYDDYDDENDNELDSNDEDEDEGEDENEDESENENEDEDEGEINRTMGISIKIHVDCLMQLAPSLEHVSNHLELATKKALVVSPTNFKISKPAEIYVHNIRDKFSSADTVLVERLGEANWQRHIRVRKEPKQNLQEFVDESFEDPVEIAQIFTSSNTFHDSGIDTSIHTKSSYTVSMASHSSFKTGFTERRNGTPHVPRLPEEFSRGESYKCDICGHTLSNISDRIQWKMHIFADLQPYICTISDCESELVTFPTRKQWAEHEFNHHHIDIYWQCPECDAKLPSSTEWEDHLQQKHEAKFTFLQPNFQSATNAAKREPTKPASSLKCPLCLKNPGPTERAFKTHLGRHMEEIALATLPQEMNSDVEYSSDSSEVLPEGGEYRNQKESTYNLVQANLDSGLNYNLISLSIVEALGLEVEHLSKPESLTVVGLSGGRQILNEIVRPQWTTTSQLRKTYVDVKFYVVKDLLCDMMLGRDFINKNRLDFNGVCL
ncbi:MAG: hypothetical protein M1834_006577 [Cirrosporium novae-zelandiae]|nr:MAG: hypothetical protein M1834_006577 [Cirrosporium novae-zelandiae]